MTGRPAYNQMNMLRAWLLATRLPTLPAAVVPVLVGTAAAIREGHFRPLGFVAALLAALLIQIGTNFINDYYDFLSGADTSNRKGPIRPLQLGLVAPRTMFLAAALCFLIAALLGLYLIYLAGWPILVIGIAAIIAAVTYTGGPIPYGYIGLGDLFVFIFFGLVAVMGTYYVHAESVNAFVLLLSLPVAALVTAILVVNNVRDIDSDKAAGKKTLAVIIGDRAARSEYLVLILVAYLTVIIGVISGILPIWSAAVLFTLPLAIRSTRTVLYSSKGPELNSALKATGRLHLIFGLILSVTLLV